MKVDAAISGPTKLGVLKAYIPSNESCAMKCLIVILSEIVLDENETIIK